ncbi:class V chitinase-like protein [Thermochaetoides thermophila DSM 1495]|uniref:Class V chitinase-like protein n=1 Tax=Chaetomium thermophilum (strain DSM 1495 / CBS 144.50 / IMI 039719) TaxID=759272 RepID=G0SG96_CHATD|nr:class V chitinase-like protein [Thermochaetoides thermophila DSM 1495]EGS17235.1 class V chitinase-like protein [Thermochaetoides thermophila DSM 1495]
MLQPGCWGPDCFFNGNRINTNAKKGKCTATSGYIADAEVAEILQDPKRVVRSFVDKDSDSDILVYDTNQWVGYMSNTTKHARAALYASWGLGGTTDWATDLQKFNPVPAPAKDWETFKRLIELGENPKLDHTRDPSWVQFDCSNDITRSKIGYPPSVRWKALNSDAAWEDIIRIWKNVRDDNQGDTFAPSFLTSITETMGFATPRCDSVLDCGCDRRYECPNKANNPESGPAAEFIMNSLVEIHRMYHDYYRALTDEMAIINTALDDMENTFAPVPEPDDKSLVNLLVDLLTLGTLSIGAGWFNTVLKQTAYFRSRGSDVFDNIKDVTQILIGQGTTIAKDVLPDKEKKWSQEGKDKFTHYLGDVVDGWLKIVNMTLVKIFDGSDSSIDLLWKAMSDGKLIEGKVLSQSTLSDGDRVKTLRDLTQATVFAFGIPALWRYSGNYAFVMDSGLKCSDSTAPLSQYLEDDVIKKTSACIENKQYYLVYPRQKPTRRCWCTNLDELRGLCLHEECRSFPFAGPPGLDELDGEKWAGLRLEDFIKGALKTWEMNGWKNDARLPDPNDEEDIKKLMRGDVKESGLIRLPVCSPERAYQSWDTSKKGSTRNYPCDIPPGLSFCGISTFVDQTSGASPSVKDCEQIIRNIEGDGKTSWRSPVVFGKPHRTIAKFGGCSFGVEATNENGNIFFDVGGQDVIDLINDAVQRFGKTGKVGALGFMKCKGNIKDQEVKWGIF